MKHLCKTSNHIPHYSVKVNMCFQDRMCPLSRLCFFASFQLYLNFYMYRENHLNYEDYKTYKLWTGISLHNIDFSVVHIST